jgi:hypothetical protein
MKKLFLLLLSILFAFSVKAQESLKADAGGNKHFCYGDEIRLGGEPTASGGVPPYTYNWWAKGFFVRFVDENTGANPKVISSGDFTAYVEVRDAVGNIATDSAVISVSGPSFAFLPECNYPEEYYISYGDSVWFAGACVMIFGSFASFSWQTSEGLEVSNNLYGFWVKPEVTTSYHLTVTDTHGCSENTESFCRCAIYKVYVNRVGVNEHDVSNQIIVYPNPANEILYFSDETDFEILDIQGKVLLQSKSAVKSIDISSLKAGLYFVKMGNQIMKFVKE